MSGRRATAHRLWTGVLLLAVQLAAAFALPLGHHAEADPADHVETPGSHNGGHNEAACHVCRHADARFLPGAGSAGLVRSTPQSFAPGGTPHVLLPSSRFDATSAPRAPPFA